MSETLAELVVKITADAAQLKREMAKAEQATGTSTKKMGRDWDALGQKMTSAGKQMSMKVTAPIVAAGAAAFKMAGDFDQAFRRTNVMLGASSEQAVEYKKRILEISNTVGKSATDVADAFYQIVSAGYRGADSLDILEVAMKGATGGAAQTESTMAALTKAMNIFEMSGVPGATKAMDIFFGIVDTGLLSFEQMASAFPQAASAAAALGVPIEEVGAMLGTLTRTMGSTDMASMAMKNAFMQLVKPSDKLKDLYEEWGVKTGPEAIETFGGFTGVLKKVAEATGGNVDELAELFPSIRALAGMIPLVTTSADDYARALDTVTNSTGATSDAFNEMAQGPGFQLKQTFTMIKNAGIELGDALSGVIAPMLKKLGEGISGLVGWFRELNPGIQRAIIVIIGMVAAIGPLLIVVGQLMKLYAAYNTLMATHVVMVIKSAIAEKAHTIARIAGIVATKAMAIAQWALNAAMTANPIGLIIMLIGGLVAAGIALYKNWDKVVDFFKKAWSKIKLFFLSGVHMVLVILDKLMGFLPGLGPKIKAAKEKIEGMIDAETVGQKAKDFQKNVEKLADELVEGIKTRLEEQRELERQSYKDQKADAQKAYDDAIDLIRDKYGVLEGEAREHEKTLLDMARDEYDELKRLKDKELDDAKDALDEKLVLLDKEYDAKLRNLDMQTSIQIDALNAQLKAIDAQTDAEERAIKQAAQEQKLIDLQAAIDSADTDKDRLSATAELKDYETELERERLLDARAAQKDSIRAQMDEVRSQADYNRDILKEELENKRIHEGELYEATSLRLEQEKLALDDALEVELVRIDDARIAVEEAESAKLEATQNRLNEAEAAMETSFTNQLTETQLHVQAINEATAQLQDRVVTITTQHVDAWETPAGTQTTTPAPPGIGQYVAGYAEGGIVPGPMGAPQLAMVHGGETITPAGESGNITVNFTQPVFFDREDQMNKFVDMIRKGIQRQDRLRFGGAYNG